MAESLKQKTVNGMAWATIEKFTTSGINFVFNMLIARILMPSDYGMVAMLGIFLAVSNCFIDSGFANALIRKSDRTEEDYNTVFYFNIAISILAYLILFFSAPLIAKFYKTPFLTTVTRLVSLNLVIGSFASIQGIHLTVKLDFKTRAMISFACALISGIVGVWMAYNHYGVMALIAQGLTSSVVACVLKWIIVHWKPRLIFSKKSFHELFSFGSRLLASNLINTVFNNIYTLVIGKVFSPVALGNYSKADNISQFPSSGMSGVIQTVSYPALSTIHDDDERLLHSFRKFIRMSAFATFPMMVGLAAIADPFIRLCLTDKWEESIPLLQLLCFSSLLWPIQVLDMNVLKVKGRSDYYLRLEVIRKMIMVVFLCITIPFGLKAMCWGLIVNSWVTLPVVNHYTAKVIGYSFKNQIADIIKPLILSLLMGALVTLIVIYMPNIYLRLILGVLAGFCFYIGIAKITKSNELDEVLDIVGTRFKRK